MKPKLRISGATLALGLLVLAHAGPAHAQLRPEQFGIESPCCDIRAEKVVWVGNEPEMSLEQLAAHCAPILWFSPDEPLLLLLEPGDPVNIPTSFPFDEPADTPVVYYRIRSILRTGDGEVLKRDGEDLGLSQLRLDQISAIEIDYFFYYPSEEGFGRHEHDTESVEMKIAVWLQEDCDDCRYGLTIEKVTAKAHGVLWYDNTLVTDTSTSFPITILVEEGKHASCTDKNGDGVYTPGYDVNVRINDAWGVRDVLGQGVLFSGGFKSWFAKTRVPKDRIFPPLLDSSRARRKYLQEGQYAPPQPQYALRPMPPVEKAREHPDESIMRFADKGFHEWPYVIDEDGFEALAGWVESDEFAKSLSVALRIDRNVGVSFVFPLFILKNLYLPLTGGWLVNRVYLTDKNFRDVGYNVIYTSSASRWMDGYVSLGVEWDTESNPGPEGGTHTTTYMATEAGLKFRGNVMHSPLSWFGKITEFWGLRVGIRYLGSTEFKSIGYVLELGAGAF